MTRVQSEEEVGMRKPELFGVVAVIAVALASNGVWAGDADDQKAMARAQRMLRQMSQERDALQAENARFKSEIEELNRKLGSQKKTSESALAKSREGNAALSENLQKTAQNLRQIEMEKTQLQATVADQAQLIESCEASNVKLLQINRELLVDYDKKGFMDAMLQREPLTQLKRVEIENIVQEYQDKIDHLEFKKKMAEAATR
jgi:chromosome segregation ATPase